MQINDLKVTTAKPEKKRVGRGGKKGTYSGKGSKGQKARSGFSQRATFEGGRSTLIAHTKKSRGFKSLVEAAQVVTTADLEKKFADEEVVTALALKEKGLIRHADKPIKILTKGGVKKKLTIKNIPLSASAKKILEKAGGKIEIDETKEATE